MMSQQSVITFCTRVSRSKQQLQLAVHGAVWPASRCRLASRPSGRRPLLVRCPGPPESSGTPQPGCRHPRRRKPRHRGRTRWWRCPSSVRTTVPSGGPGPVATSGSCGVCSHGLVRKELAQLEVSLQDVGAADHALEVVHDPPVVSHHGEELGRVIVVVRRLVHVEAG